MLKATSLRHTPSFSYTLVVDFCSSLRMYHVIKYICDYHGAAEKYEFVFQGCNLTYYYILNSSQILVTWLHQLYYHLCYSQLPSFLSLLHSQNPNNIRMENIFWGYYAYGYYFYNIPFLRRVFEKAFHFAKFKQFRLWLYEVLQENLRGCTIFRRVASTLCGSSCKLFVKVKFHWHAGPF